MSGYTVLPLSDSFSVQRCLTWAEPSAFSFQPQPPLPREVYRDRPVLRTRPVSASAVERTRCHHHERLQVHASHSRSTMLRPSETTVTRNAPYAPRLVDCHFYATTAPSIGGASVVPGGGVRPKSSYSPLTDPHLYDYYVRKFMAMDPLLPARSARDNRGDSTSRSGKRRSASHSGAKKTTKSIASYHVSITTGSKTNAGTTANVYLTIKGSKAKLPKRHLTYKQSSKKPKNAVFRFNKNTTHVFKYDAADVGNIESIVVEHDGVTEEEGWYLEQVKITKITSRGEKTWIFACQNWLSLHEGDCQTRRQLYAQHSTKTEYEVVVVTGNMKGAGTDANVFLTVFGKSGQTPKLQLKSTGEENTFERNKSDKFLLKTKCVGPMTKIRIQHDNTGFAPGWFLERVVVTDRKNPKWTYYFPCSQWLAKDEDDGLICRDLQGSTDPLAARRANRYKVSVFTGDKFGAGTDANVSITLFGDAGESGEKKLDNKNKNDFERNRKDEFAIECPSVGTLQRIRIGHDNTGSSPGWFLDKVIIDDLDNNRVYEFPCNRWLAKSEDDGQISRELLCGTTPGSAPPGIPYTITVKTGDEPNAGTSAGVFAILYGGKDGDRNSGKIWLSNGKFERNRTDIFHVEAAEMLSPLSRIDIGHDNKGAAPGWFLDEVVVNCPSAGWEQTFRCQKWFALDEGDRVIERTLYETSRKKRDKMVTWFIRVYTADERGAGTDANVQLVVYGKNEKGESVKSDEIRLDNKGDNFEQGQEDQFRIETVDVGKPYKIRISHDNSKPFSAWKLDRVEMESMATHKLYTFRCGRWLATNEDDGCIVRELPAEGEDIKKPQPVVKYVAKVHTGKKAGAGTDADVFLNIFGTQGDTGERALAKSATNKNKFERGNVDDFIIEAVTLKKLNKIRVGHNSTKASSGWFLDKVQIHPQNDPSQCIEFLCNRWLDVKEDDGLTVREILAGPGGVQMLSTTSYHVSVKTGKKTGASTDANVFIKIFGSKGDTGILKLLSADNNKNKFEAGRIDLFKLEATDIGKLQKIRIGHDGSNPGAGWFLDEVRVDIPSKGECYTFGCHRWLDKKEADGQIEIEIEPTNVEKGVVRIPYELTVWTGKERGAGTDSNVFIQMYGENGKTEEYMLRNRTDNFEQGQVDKFKIEAADVGPLLKVRVGHDGKGTFAGWFLDKILIQRHPTRNSKRRLKRRNSGSIRGRERDEPDRRSLRSGRHNRDEENSESDDGLHVRGNRLRHKDNPDDRSSTRGSRISKRRGSRDSRSDEEQRLRKRPQSAGRHRPSSRASSGTGSDSETDEKRRPKNGRRRDSESGDEEFDRKSAASSKGRKKSVLSLGKGRVGAKQKRDSDYSDDDDDDYVDRKSVASSKALKGRRKSRDDDDDRKSTASSKGRRKSLTRNDEANRHRNSDSEENDQRKKRRGRDDIESSDDRELPNDPDDIEEYWFVCRKWFAKGEGDGKIVRELLPTTEDGQPIKGGLDEVEYVVKVKTGDKFQAGTDANVFVTITGEFGDTGERELKQSNNINKFERNNEDIFKISAVELGKLTKLKIRHDNAGGGAAWYLDHVEVEDPRSNKPYFFACQRWLATDKDDGQIARVLVPNGRKGSQGALETESQKTKYVVRVFTGDKLGAGTDANVHIYLFGEIDDTGKNLLKKSKTNKNKFERNQMDEFDIEAVDIGELKKIKIGHDNAGGGGAWYLDHVEIDCPSLGKKWYFPHGRWLAKDKDDGQLERELIPQDMSTEEYRPCIPYEITTYTSDVKGAGTEADVYVVLYGKDTCTSQKSLCPNKNDRGKKFDKGKSATFVVELEEIFGEIEKLRIGHDGKGFGAGWHLDRVEVRRLKDSGKGSETYVFPCNRWLAKDEDDKAIERELVANKVFDETVKKDGTVRKRELERRNTLVSKKYTVNVVTGDKDRAGTDANVFLTIFGENGDTGERALEKSETNRNKFERNQTDRFIIEAVDLGKIFKVKIRHDDKNLSSDWYLDRVEVIDPDTPEPYMFHCERWLAKNKDDKKIEKTLYVKGYRGDMSSASTMHSRAFTSVASIDSVRSSDPFSKSPRLMKRHMSMENIPEGPTMPYTVKIKTGSDKSMGTDSNVYIKIVGTKKRHTGKQFLENGRFSPGSIRTFSLECVDIGEVKEIELGHDGEMEDSGWFVKEVEVDVPTKGKHYFFKCNRWLAKDEDDGLTVRTFTLDEGEASIVNYKPLVPYEVTFHTGDIQDAGTDSQVFIKVFGVKGASSDINIEKASERFERGRVDMIKLELEDIAPLKKLRVGHNGKGARADWYLEKVVLRNMDTGDLYQFHVKAWLSKTRDDKLLVRDIPATVKGKSALQATTYKVSVKTSDVSGAGTDASVFVVLFGENGDSGDIELKDSETYKNPFENNQVDVFTVPNILSLGRLMKVRVWHDNSGLGAAWHLAHIEVEDTSTGQKYLFPCDKWLSKKDGDKQICRELLCTNLPSPRTSDRITYQIEVTTSDRQDAGTQHNAWIILEGDEGKSKEFVVDNGPKKKILRRGQTDPFRMTSRNLGSLTKCIVGLLENDSVATTSKDTQWHCDNVTVTNTDTGDKYIFACKDWIRVRPDISRKHAKVLELKTVEESQLTAAKNLGPVKYEIDIFTGNESGAGTNANVSITIYGTNGDTGKRPLTKSFRDLFEKNQKDNFDIEVVDLGDLTKVKIEHDNAGFRPGWFLDRIEITNTVTKRKWTFPCNAWLDKSKGDHTIERELFPRD